MKHWLLEHLQIFRHYLFLLKKGNLSPEHLQRLQDLARVCILMIRNQGNIVRGQNLLVAALQLCWNSQCLLQHTWEATSAYRLNLEMGSRCRLKIMSSSGFGGDGLSLCSGISVTNSHSVLWDELTALLVDPASSSCFITSFGILSRITASSRFWHPATAWAVGRWPQPWRGTGCHGLNSSGVKVGLQWSSLNCSYPTIFATHFYMSK